MHPSLSEKDWRAQVIARAELEVAEERKTRPKAFVTADQLQRFAVRLSNSGYTRHWLHWNHPIICPVRMAISVIAPNGTAKRIRDFDQMEIPVELSSGLIIYTFVRIETDGTLFFSEL
jgi:hypothetical protein